MSYQLLPHHGNPNPTVPQPAEPPQCVVVTVQDGLPVLYSEDTIPVCGVRVVHPSNPAAPSVQHSVVMLYVPPQGEMARHCHETEETYVIIDGEGTMLFADREQPVSVGDFIYLPAWGIHGIRNTGRAMLSVLLATSPPNP